VALRQLGIRTATGLLQVFPPGKVAADCHVCGTIEQDPRWVLPPCGIDVLQLRTLMRVLSQDPGLTPVWSSQREESRTTVADGLTYFRRPGLALTMR
jgi:hypothetical protein